MSSTRFQPENCAWRRSLPRSSWLLVWNFPHDFPKLKQTSILLLLCPGEKCLHIFSHLMEALPWHLLVLQISFSNPGSAGSWGCSPAPDLTIPCSQGHPVASLHARYLGILQAKVLWWAIKKIAILMVWVNEKQIRNFHKGETTYDSSERGGLRKVEWKKWRQVMAEWIQCGSELRRGSYGQWLPSVSLN